MGKYDDLLADLPNTQSSNGGGRFADLLSDLGPPPQSTWDAVKIALGSRPELMSYGGLKIPNAPSGPISGALDTATQTLAAPIRTGMTMQTGFPKAGEAIAESEGAEGYPRAGIAAGMGVSMIPALANTALGLKEIYSSNNPIVKGLVNTPQELSPEYDVLHEAAGISKNLPETGGRVARFPNMAGQPSTSPPPFAPAITPSSYPRDPNAMINFMRARIEGLGDQLSPQELNDQKTLLSQLMDTGKLGQGKPLAMAAQLRSQASDLLNNKVQGLADLNKAYSLASKLQNPSQMLPQAIQDIAKKYGPWILRIAGGAEVYRALTGHQ